MALDQGGAELRKTRSAKPTRQREERQRLLKQASVEL